MSSRRALLIGAEDYGQGFAPLPAVRKDVELLHSALEAAGYEVAECPRDVLTNAGKLDEDIRKFCRGGGPEDIHVLYFTGHGLLADDVEWIVPASTHRKDATLSSNRRRLHRSQQDRRRIGYRTRALHHRCVPGQGRYSGDQGRRRWGDSMRIARPGEHRFIRFFGCAANQVCQVLSSSAGEPSLSLFTKASLRASWTDSASHCTTFCRRSRSDAPSC